MLALAGGRWPHYARNGGALADRLGWSSRLGCFSRAGLSNELDMARKWAERSQHGFGEHPVPSMYKPCAVECGMMPPGAGDIASSCREYWISILESGCGLDLQAM